MKHYKKQTLLSSEKLKLKDVLHFLLINDHQKILILCEIHPTEAWKLICSQDEICVKRAEVQKPSFFILMAPEMRLKTNLLKLLDVWRNTINEKLNNRGINSVFPETTIEEAEKQHFNILIKKVSWCWSGPETYRVWVVVKQTAPQVYHRNTRQLSTRLCANVAATNSRMFAVFLPPVIRATVQGSNSSSGFC